MTTGGGSCRLRRLGLVITAGGTGNRMGASIPKQFLALAGRPVLAHTLDSVLAWTRGLEPGTQVIALVLTHPADAAAQSADLLAASLAAASIGSGREPVLRLVPGGPTRQESVRLALQSLPQELDAVFIHDGARPLATPALFNKLLLALEQNPEALGAVPLLHPGDTLKRVEGEADALVRVRETLDREQVRAVQTPQLFRWPRIRELHQQAWQTGVQGTDDAALVEILDPGAWILGVPGEAGNVKITRPHDLMIAEACLVKEPAMEAPGLRVGQGFDVHAFVAGRPLILGGVAIPHPLGLAGHSDADVLLHAITDALLGAAALDDIGRHFPDTDPAWKGADSWDLLREACRRVREAGFIPVNVDATVICELPKIRPFVPAMRGRIAQALDLPLDAVNVKGTTTEQLGFTGRGEGIAAQAMLLLKAR